MAQDDRDKRIQHPLRIEQLIEPDRLLQILERDAKSAGITYRLMDIDGNWISHAVDRPGFCQTIQTTPQGQDFCLQCNREYLKQAAAADEPILHRCEAGLVDSIAAIRVSDEVIGYVHGMQVLSEPPSSEQIDKIHHLAWRLQMENKQEALKAALNATPIMSADGIREAAQGLKEIVTELTHLSWYARQVSVFDETTKRLAGFSSKDDIREALLDGVEALLGEVNVCVFLLEDDRRLHLFGARRESRDLASLTVKVGDGYIGWVAEKHKHLLVSDIDAFKDVRLLRREQGSNRELKSALTVPILSINDRIIGVLQVAARVVDAFDQSAVHSLKALASIAGMALERYRLESSVQAIRVEERKLVPRELDAILKSYLQTGRRMLDFSSADIGLLDIDGKTLEIRTAIGPLERFYHLRIDGTQGLSGKVISQGTTEAINDLTQEGSDLETRRWPEGKRYGNLLGTIGSTVKTPLRAGDKVIGVLSIYWDEPNVIPSTAVSVIEFLAEGISSIIETIQSQTANPWLKLILELMDLPIKSEVDIAIARRKLFQRLADEALRITRSVCSNVRLYEDRDETLRFAATAGAGWTDEINDRVFTIRDASAAIHVVKSGRPFIIPDTRLEIDYKELFPNVRSHLSVPIFFRKAVAGVLSVDADQVNGFSLTDSSNLQLLANQCAMMLEHFALIEERWLYDLELFMSDTSELDRLLEGAKPYIQKLFDAKYSIFLRYPSTNVLRLAATTGIKEKTPDALKTYEIGEGLTGWIAEHKQILRLRNTANREELKSVSKDIHWAQKWNEDLDYEAERDLAFLGAPLTVHDELIGVIRLSIKKNQVYFTYNDELLIKSLADRLALSIQNNWLTQERNKRVKQLEAFTRQLEAFTRLGDQLAENLSLKKVAQLILEQGIQIVDCDAGHIRIFDTKDRNLKLVCATGRYAEQIPTTRGLGEGISGKVARSLEPLFVPDVHNDPSYAKVLAEDFGQPQEVFLNWVRSGACVPLIVQNELVGTLHMHWSKTMSFETGDLSRFIIDLANRSAIAIKAALMFEEIEVQLNQKTDAQERLREIVLEFAQTMDVDTLLKRLLESALKESGFNSGMIRLREHNKWVLKEAMDDFQEGLKEMLAPELEVKDDILKHAADEGKTRPILDLTKDEEFQSFIHDYPGTRLHEFHLSIRSAVIIPLQLGERCLGLLILNSREPHPLPRPTILNLELLAGHAAIAIDNAQLNAERERALRLAEPLAILGSMIGSFLHELRTPLQVLTGSLNITQHRNFDLSKLSGPLGKMREQILAMTNILEDLVLFARKDSAALRESVDLNLVIEKAVRDSSYQFGRRIVCERKLADPSPIVRGNRAQLERAFKLVIGNAVDAMPEGGSLRIESSYGADPDEAFVRFSDDGIGMSEHTKAKCLEPFFTTKQSGTGLGLSVVYGIVMHHTGKIQIDSQLGKGTTVTLTFQKGREA